MKAILSQIPVLAIDLPAARAHAELWAGLDADQRDTVLAALDER
jgi:hypothetical protein